ncbi:MAG: hypothetical protein WCI11_20495, partial [Candidatus Methylumidiphilus sp.]
MARMKPSGRNPGFAWHPPDCAAGRLYPGYLLSCSDTPPSEYLIQFWRTFTRHSLSSDTPPSEYLIQCLIVLTA